MSGDSANYWLGLAILAALVVAVIARYHTWKREYDRAIRIGNERIAGRQQLRSAARAEAFHQIGGVPIDRKTRRTAAREVATATMKRKKEKA